MRSSLAAAEETRAGIRRVLRQVGVDGIDRPTCRAFWMAVAVPTRGNDWLAAQLTRAARPLLIACEAVGLHDDAGTASADAPGGRRERDGRRVY